MDLPDYRDLYEGQITIYLENLSSAVYPIQDPLHASPPHDLGRRDERAQINLEVFREEARRVLRHEGHCPQEPQQQVDHSDGHIGVLVAVQEFRAEAQGSPVPAINHR